MKRNYHIFILIGLLMFIASCEKAVTDLPESNDPVFTLNGNLNGQEISMIAGDDGAFMHTMTERVNGVDVYSGRLEKDDLSIELGIYQGDVDMPGSNILEVLEQTSEWSFENNQMNVVLSKEMFANATLISSVSWVINDMAYAASEVSLTEPGVYDVCAFVYFEDMTSAQLCNEIIIGYERHSNFRINHYVSQDSILHVWMGDVYGDVFESLWYLDGTLIGKNLDVDIEVDGTTHEVKAEVKFEDGTFRTKKILVDGSSSGNFIDDFTVFEEQDAGGIFRDYQWRLMVEQNGMMYYSEHADNTNSVMNITSIQSYGKNSSGKNVYNITCEVDAFVGDLTGSSQIPISFNTTFGIEIDN